MYPYEGATLPYEYADDAATAFWATLVITVAFAIHVFLTAYTVCVHGCEKSCACDKY